MQEIYEAKRKTKLTVNWIFTVVSQQERQAGDDPTYLWGFPTMYV